MLALIVMLQSGTGDFYCQIATVYLGGQIIKRTLYLKICSPKAEFDRTLMKLQV